ncbi:MAG: patatin-like phospholipase family protein [Anaerolineaceae bacterium]|nr:patatin-like phospholipase family protein [Anaerolineaceae bacterium]
MSKEVVLALGGGGMRGIAHIGVIRCLEENGYKIKGIAGTSAGGMIGALYASGASLEEIDSLVKRFSEKPAFSRKRGDSASLLGITVIEDLLRDVLTEKLIEDFPIKFVATAVNLDTEREVVITSGKAIDAVLSTIAMPGILPPRYTQDGLLIDGGVLDPVPVGLARQLNPSLPIVAVCLYKKHWEEAKSHSTLPFEALVPKHITQRLAKNRFVEAFTIFYKAMDLINDRMADANLLLDQPDVLVAPMVGHYHTLDVEIPDDLEKRGFEAMQLQLGQLEKSMTLVNSLMRIAKYTDSSNELEPTIKPLTPPEEGNQS